MSRKVHTIEKGEGLTYISKIGKNDNITYKRSKNDMWCDTMKGKKVGTLKDDGDNVIIKMGNVDITLDYSDFCELADIIEIKLLIDKNMRGKVKHKIKE